MNLKLYALRAFRYLLKMVVIIAVVILILSLTDSLNIEALLSKGVMFAALILVLTIVYPKLSFTKIDLRIDYPDNRQAITDSFQSLGYVLVTEEGDTMQFRMSSTLRRLLSEFNDKATVMVGEKYVEIEGPKKIVARVEPHIKIALRKER